MVHVVFGVLMGNACRGIQKGLGIVNIKSHTGMHNFWVLILDFVSLDPICVVICGVICAAEVSKYIISLTIGVYLTWCWIVGLHC